MLASYQRKHQNFENIEEKRRESKQGHGIQNSMLLLPEQFFGYCLPHRCSSNTLTHSQYIFGILFGMLIDHDFVSPLL